MICDANSLSPEHILYDRNTLRFMQFRETRNVDEEMKKEQNYNVH
jgi:hypothetical protein